MKEITIVEKVPDVTFGKYFCFQVNCYQHNVMCTYSLSPGSPPTGNCLMDFSLPYAYQSIYGGQGVWGRG